LAEIMNYPFVVLAVSFLLMFGAAHLGSFFSKKRRLDDGEREDFGVVVAATLTLLGLIIGFSFSMATSRYDQRKNLEEAEANAIGTELVRAELLPPADTAKIVELLKRYLDQRLLRYDTHDPFEVRRLSNATARLQGELWSAVKGPALAQPTPISALAVAGMNDVINSQSYTQAAVWNRIPFAAWMLMLGIAIASNLLLGFGMRRRETEGAFLLVLPAIVAIAFFLIADIDSPRSGIIRVHAQNLEALKESLSPPKAP
jgi:hypothetical protein